MPVAFESIEQASRSGSEAVQRLLQGEQETSREVRVENARAALAMLDAELKDLGRAEKKNIIEGSRVILQSALESTTQEIRAAADERLESLAEDQRTNLEGQRRLLEFELKNITDIRERALELQRELEDSFVESAGNAARETLNDFRNITATQAVMYGAAGLGIGAIGYKISSWLFGTKDKPTFLRRTFAFLGGLLGVAAGAVGLKMIQDRLPKIPTATDAVDAVKNEAYNGLAYFNNNYGPGAFFDGMKMSPTSGQPTTPKEDPELAGLSPHEKLVKLIEKGSYLKAYQHAKENGGGLLFSDGQGFLNVADHEPIELTPDALGTIQQYINSIDDDNAIIFYLEGGAAYIASRALLQLWLNGKNPIPMSRGAVVKTIGKVIAAPLVAASDILTISKYTFSGRGWEPIKFAFWHQAVPVRGLRGLNNLRRSFLNMDIRSEAGLLRTIQRRMEAKNRVDVLQLVEKRGSDGKALKGSQLAMADAELEILDGRVKAGLTVMEGRLNEGKAIQNPALLEMVHEREKKSSYDHNMQRLFGKKTQNVQDDSVVDSASSEQTSAAESAPAAETQAAPSEQAAPAGSSVEQQHIVELEAEIESHLSQIADLSQKADKNAAQIVELNTRVGELTEKLEYEREVLQQQLDAERRYGAAVREHADFLEEQLFVEQTRADSNQNEVTRLESELAQVRQQLERVTVQNEAAVEEAAERSAGHVEDLEKLQAQLDENAAARTALEAELKKARAEAAHYRDQYEASRGERESLSSSPSEHSSQSGRTNPDDGPASSPAVNPSGGDRFDPNAGPAAEETTSSNPARRPRPKPTPANFRRLTPESAARQRSDYQSSGLRNGDDRFNPASETDGTGDTQIKPGRR